jgi:2-dehydro-3-deoxygluconokinase
MTEIVTIGECLISLVASARGPLAEAPTFIRTVAGAEANVAVGLARLGRRVAYVGRVGDDAFGLVVLRKLRGEGVDCDALAVTPGAPTGVMIRELRDIGPMEVIYHRVGSAASRMGPEVVDAAIRTFADCRWLHITGITPAISASAAAAVERAVDLARGGDATISLDLNIRRRLWPESTAVPVLRALAARCRVVLGGLDEVALVGGLAATLEAGSGVDPEQAADAMLALGPERAVVKLGAGGALERRIGPDGAPVTLRAPAMAVPSVVDPVGAGDAFTAAWIAWTLDGADPMQALRAGNAAGAAVVSTVGDLTGLPTRRELDALLAAGGGPDTIR